MSGRVGKNNRRRIIGLCVYNSSKPRLTTVPLKHKWETMNDQMGLSISMFSFIQYIKLLKI